MLVGLLVEYLDLFEFVLNSILSMLKKNISNQLIAISAYLLSLISFDYVSWINLWFKVALSNISSIFIYLFIAMNSYEKRIDNSIVLIVFKIKNR